MIALPAGTHIWVACGVTDMRKGFDSLAMVAQEVVKQSPRSGHVFVFRGPRADRLRFCGGTGPAFAFMPNAWSVGVSFGR